MADAEHARPVERDDVAVMFKRVADEQTAISRGWAEVEKALGSLRGRKFYGVSDGAKGEYRVCVQPREEDEPTELGLETGHTSGSPVCASAPSRGAAGRLRTDRAYL